jgi:hypothetical protein
MAKLPARKFRQYECVGHQVHAEKATAEDKNTNEHYA